MMNINDEAFYGLNFLQFISSHESIWKSLIYSTLLIYNHYLYIVQLTLVIGPHSKAVHIILST